MIMRFRPANISLINRRHYLPRLLLTLSSKYNDKNNLSDSQILTGHTISIYEWSFKKTVGYHGEVFIDPEDGTIARVITYAELKPTDYVHLEAVRTDFSLSLSMAKNMFCHWKASRSTKWFQAVKAIQLPTRCATHCSLRFTRTISCASRGGLSIAVARASLLWSEETPRIWLACISALLI